MSQNLSLALRQEQRLTPQLIQSMNILQLPLLALEAKVREEMERNPALEEEEPDRLVPAPGSAAAPEPGVLDDLPMEAEKQHQAEGFRQLERMSREYDLDDGDQSFGRRRPDTGERDAKLDAMANTASRPESLVEYLQHQWAFVHVDGRLRDAGELILNYIEEDGYLRTPLAEIADHHVPPFTIEEVEEALSWVQTLEPAGIAARDLRECLLIQLGGLDGDVELERTLVEDHLADIGKNRYPAMAKATGRSIEEIKQAVHDLGKLNPHPGSFVVDKQVPRIAPDVILDYSEDGNDYTVRLARGNAPRLRVSPTYERLARDARQAREAREFSRRNVESAKALIDAIKYRQTRLLEVAAEVVQRQRDFLEIGPAGLKVLRMSELADKLNCDPSTISRTVAEKYLQTPRGIFPLRCFFTGGTEDGRGETTSWNSVKARVKDIIDREDKKTPLSDDVVAARLQGERLDVSRRTIAKYRQQMHIPTARQRREF